MVILESILAYDNIVIQWTAIWWRAEMPKKGITRAAKPPLVSFTGGGFDLPSKLLESKSIAVQLFTSEEIRKLERYPAVGEGQ